MTTQAWTWNPQEHVDVTVSATDLDWCDRLETTPRDAVVGKVLCVCAASAIARRVINDNGGGDLQSVDALELLNGWIDEPTDERFDRICSPIFKGGLLDSSTHDVVWWALRTATSSVGNFEAGWALGSLCAVASRVGLTSEEMRVVAQEAITLRARPVNPTNESSV